MRPIVTSDQSGGESGAPVRIRPATPQDVAQLASLIQRAYRGDSAREGWTHEADLVGGQRLDADLLLEILRDSAQRLLLAEEDGITIGSVQISQKSAQASYLGLLTVDPQRQGAGLGRRLLAAGEKLAIHEFGSSRMEMWVIRHRLELIAYYERRGYRLTGEEKPFPVHDRRVGVPLRSDLAFLVLEKELTSS